MFWNCCTIRSYAVIKVPLKKEKKLVTSYCSGLPKKTFSFLKKARRSVYYILLFNVHFTNLETHQTNKKATLLVSNHRK